MVFCVIILNRLNPSNNIFHAEETRMLYSFEIASD